MSCPTCGKDPDDKYSPFCSRRCADVDLARWFNESYRVPAEPVEESDVTSEEVPQPRRQ